MTNTLVDFALVVFCLAIVTFLTIVFVAYIQDRIAYKRYIRDAKARADRDWEEEHNKRYEAMVLMREALKEQEARQAAVELTHAEYMEVIRAMEIMEELEGDKKDELR